jgi:hypothetical protein
MASSRLRIYCGPEDDGVTTLDGHAKRETVSVSLGEVFPLLADAIHSERTWLRDFEDDEITISADLYEVVLAYQHCRRPTG